ncbi:MAG TPA: caspase family protein [Pyrinomonadaceae bacterium]|jgi:WD40 repeat protein|nr:caspase family protein [Pyrinomonadaceae bacterium]
MKPFSSCHPNVRLKSVSAFRSYSEIAALLFISLCLMTASAQQPTPTPATGAGQQQKRDLGLSDDAANKQASSNSAQANAGRPELVLQTGHTLMAWKIIFSPDGRLLASNSFNDGAIKLWDVEKGRQLRTLPGHTGGGNSFFSGVTAIAFSRDGRVLASGGADNTIKLWDVITGRELHAMSGSTGSLVSTTGIASLAFSPDGRVLLSAHGDGNRLWDVATGQELRTLAGDGSLMSLSGGAAFNADGKEVAALVYGQGVQVKFWDAASGLELRTANLSGQPLLLNGNSFATDTAGHLLVTTKDEEKLELWDVTAGGKPRVLSTVNQPNAFVRFSPDARLFALANGNTIQLRELETGRELRTLNVPHTLDVPMDGVYGLDWSPDGRVLATGGTDGQIRLWEVATGREVRDLLGHSNAAFNVAFSPDGTRLFSGDKTIWETTTGRGLRALAGTTNSPLGMLSRDGRWLAELSLSNSQVKLWDVAQQRPSFTLASSDAVVANGAAFSPDGRVLAVFYRSNKEQGRSNAGPGASADAGAAPPPDERQQPSAEDLKKAQKEMLKAMKRDPQALLKAAQSNPADLMKILNPQSGMVGTARPNNPEFQVKLWDVATGRELRSLSGHNGPVKSVGFSPDGHRLISGATNGEVKIWDVESGREVNSVGAQGANAGSSMMALTPLNQSEVRAVAFSPDGFLVAIGSKETTSNFDPQAMMSAAMAKANTRGGGGKGAQNPAAIRKQTEEMMKNITLSVKGPVRVWNVLTEETVLTLEGHADGTEAVAFSGDGRLLATGGGDSTIKLWDMATGRALRTLTGLTTSANSLAFSPDSRVLVSAGYDGTTRLWDVQTGEPLATLVSLYDGGEWLVITPDGLFDGSPAAWNQILWRYAQDTFNVAPIEWFFNEFYDPGLLSEIMSGKRPKAPRDISQLDRRQPKVRLALADTPAGPTETVSARDLKLKIEVVEAPADKEHTSGSGARDLRLFRNGSLVKVWHDDVLRGTDGKVTFEQSVPLIAGENRFTAYAFNRDNVKSVDAVLPVNGADSLKRVGTTYILAVGVNNYANPQYNLKYAVADARAFGEEFARQQVKMESSARVELITLLDQDATKANILAALKRLSGEAATTLPTGAPESLLKLKPAQPEDVVIIYYAGHGTAQQSAFYLIPHDLGYQGERTKLDQSGLQSVLAHSISDKELEQSLETVDAGELLLVIDACNSGQALEAEEKRRGPMNSKGLAQLAYEKGMYILTAAQGYQAALEAAQLGHGYLTFALVEEGLKSAAADVAPHDGHVYVREWLDYATERVPLMQETKMKETRGFGFGFVEAGEKRNDSAKGDDAARSAVQRPRVFYRRELEAHPLVVARP